MRIIDLSLEIDNACMTCGTVWHEKVRVTQTGKIDEVGRNTSKIVLGSHSGTHIDAPKHFFNDSYGIDKLNLEILCGEVSVADFSYMEKGDVVSLKEVEKIKVSKRMIFRFNWYKKWKTNEYYDNFPFFSLEAAMYLEENGMKLIALDTPSPDSGRNIQDIGNEDSPVHKFLLSKEIVIAEYLNNTEKINLQRKLEIVALPLKISEIDGSPARIIVKEM